MRKNQFWICKTAAGDYLPDTMDKKRKTALMLCEDLHMNFGDYDFCMWIQARSAGWSCVRVTLEEVK